MSLIDEDSPVLENELYPRLVTNWDKFANGTLVTVYANSTVFIRLIKLNEFLMIVRYDIDSGFKIFMLLPTMVKEEDLVILLRGSIIQLASEENFCKFVLDEYDYVNMIEDREANKIYNARLNRMFWEKIANLDTLIMLD